MFSNYTMKFRVCKAKLKKVGLYREVKEITKISLHFGTKRIIHKTHKEY